jgi:hypothetical protein
MSERSCRNLDIEVEIEGLERIVMTSIRSR